MLDALRLGRDLRTAGRLIDLQLNFVVRAANWREMPAFVELAQEYVADTVWFSLLRRTWMSREEFLAESLTNEGHPDRPAFLAMLEQPEFHEPPVVAGSFLPAVHATIAADAEW